MSFFYIFLLLTIGAVGGYMIGHDTGYEEGNIKGRAEMYSPIVYEWKICKAVKL